MSPGRPAALVVDDDPLVRALLRSILEDAGWEVTEAMDGDEAVALHAPGRFDVAVVDCRMPGRDGPATLAAMRASEPDLAVLFVSGDPSRELLDLLGRDGRCRLLTKPFSPRAVLASLAGLGLPSRSQA